MGRLLVVSLRPLIGIALAALLATAAVASAASAPPGATAQCRDGSYSYSQHRSGTCSHHGGVATWLSSGGGSAATATATALGRLVLLAPRTRTGRCTLGAAPDRRCSPGAYQSALTRAVICAASFRTSSIRNVSESKRHSVEAEYGLQPGSYGRALEIDHVVPLELGGSNALANLFPEQASPRGGTPGYRVKDRLENSLHRLVCSGQLGLRTAQAGIASNWQALYREVFGLAP